MDEIARLQDRVDAVEDRLHLRVRAAESLVLDLTCRLNAAEIVLEQALVEIMAGLPDATGFAERWMAAIDRQLNAAQATPPLDRRSLADLLEPVRLRALRMVEQAEALATRRHPMPPDSGR